MKNNKDLDSQLNLRLRHPNFQKFLNFNESESIRVRQKLKGFINEKYGESELQSLDIFPSKVPNSPILLFIHGGYWRALDKKSYSYIAEPFVKNNFTTCIINYRLMPKVALNAILDDIKEAIQWIQKEAFRLNGNPNQIILSGHSAGGHLALMSYLKFENIRSSIQGICSLSGLFDLEPIKNSYLNEVLQLDVQTVKTYSPLTQDLFVLKCPLLLSVGLKESMLFIEESKKLFLKNNTNNQIEYYEYEELNHYQIVHKLGQENSLLTQWILKNGKT